MSIQTSSERIPNQDIPVLLTIFNRPDKTKAVIDNLRGIKPKKLFIAADGPRSNVPEDLDKCRLARQEATNIDWDCDVTTRFLEDNIGCDPAVSTAIGWFFRNVEYGIILEDDCLVDDQFFSFCGELLVKYANDKRIMQISSLSPYAAREHPYDYHFSRTFRCSGGWGTWRRAWQHYTSDMHIYRDREALEILKASYLDYYECLRIHRKLIAYNSGSVTIYKNGSLLIQYWAHWDFQWYLACAAQNGLCIVPEKNLMVNLGFDEDSTNTKNPNNPIFENLQVQQLRFPLRHPELVYADSRPERSLKKKIYHNLPLKSRFMYILRRTLGAIHYLRDVMPFG